MFILFVVLAVVALLVLLSCIKIVPQAQAIVVERLGAYLDTWSVGVHFKMPVVDRVAKRIILKEQEVDFPPQPVITKDNVRHGGVFPDYRSEAVCLWSGKPHYGD